jgi:uncharacterized protein YyaL (SSP411 family)
MNLPPERVQELLKSAQQKMYASRLTRQTPFVDKTIYVSWNALFVSAYLDAARTLHLNDARHFALRSLDRIISKAWNAKTGLSHVVAYSEAQASKRDNSGFLDDYASTAIACLDAYETTSDISYFRIAKKIADQMIDRFYDSAAGGFFDSSVSDTALGVLATKRKPFQDSPTPAGNPMAAIALIRLNAYSGEAEYRLKAQKTLELLAGAAAQYGIFAATYGLAVTAYDVSHSQIIIVGEDASAEELYAHASAFRQLGRSVLKFTFSQAVEANLPPSLAATIPHLPAVKQKKTSAIVCSAGSCKPPVHNIEQLDEMLRGEKSAA